MPSLYRLFPREVETSHRLSTALDPTAAQTDNTAPVTIDPWRVVTDIAKASRDGLSRSLQWLCVFSRSGVDIPVSTYMQFSSLVTKSDIPLANSLLLVNAAMMSSWLKSMGRHQLQMMFSAIHAQLAPHVLDCLKNNSDSADM